MFANSDHRVIIKTIFNEAKILANSSVWSMTARNSSNEYKKWMMH